MGGDQIVVQYDLHGGDCRGVPVHVVTSLLISKEFIGILTYKSGVLDIRRVLESKQIEQ